MAKWWCHTAGVSLYLSLINARPFFNYFVDRYKHSNHINRVYDLGIISFPSLLFSPLFCVLQGYARRIVRINTYTFDSGLCILSLNNQRRGGERHF